MKVFQFILFTFVFLIVFSCKKNGELPEVKPDPAPDTKFAIPTTKDIVMYEINLRAFSNSGDIPGISNRLDQIKALGINVIWLMPIYPIGEINSVNSPYSVKNYQEVNTEFGTLSDLKDLVSEAHKKGMAVILDWVANHTAWDNPWIINKDWYTQDGNGNIIHPAGTNWMDVADLNYDSKEMRAEMIKAMKYWIENADIDGFRCDAADWVPYDFWKQAIDSLNNYTEKDLILLAEGARSDHFTAGFDLNFSWDFYNRLKKVFNKMATAGALFTTHLSEYNNLADGKHWLRFTTNHDESAWDATPMVLFNGKNGALAASAISIFLGGVPLIYDGQEVGIEDNIPFFSNDPIEWLLNPDMLDAYRKMLNFYAASEIIHNAQLNAYAHATVSSFTLVSGQDMIFVMVNTRDSEINYSLPDDLLNKTWTNTITDGAVNLDSAVILKAYEYLILQGNL